MTSGEINLQQALQRRTEPAADSGKASGGGMGTLQDTTKKWPTNRWFPGDIHITKFTSPLTTVYVCPIVSNTDTQITFTPAAGMPPVMAGDPYSIRRVTSPTDTTLAKLIPIAKALVFNQALPAADNNILGADITPTNSPSKIVIDVCVAVAGILRVRRTRAGVTISENLNDGQALNANSEYAFTVRWRTGDSVNFWYSVTGANLLSLIVDEVGVG